jgi:hypothetical protein
MSIVGQILDDLDPSGAMRDIAVLAVRGSKTLDRTVTIHSVSSISSHIPAASSSSRSTFPKSAPSPSSRRGARRAGEKARTQRRPTEAAAARRRGRASGRAPRQEGEFTMRRRSIFGLAVLLAALATPAAAVDTNRTIVRIQRAWSAAP